MIVAAVDIGTNSLLLLIAEVQGGRLEPLLELATITRLGEGVDRTGQLSPAACQRSLECLTRYAAEIARAGAERLDVVGTSALRDARNGETFLEQAERCLGVRPRVISGLEEAELTFQGALSGLALTGAVTVLDIGGGSTEIISGTAGAGLAERAVSFDIGSVRLFERHVRSDPPSAGELALAQRDIEQALSREPRPAAQRTAVGVAGTVTQLAALELELAQFDPNRVHGYALTRRRVREIADELARATLSERRARAGMEAARADVIVCGVWIAHAFLEWLNADALLVSSRGLRFGVAQALAARAPSSLA